MYKTLCQFVLTLVSISIQSIGAKDEEAFCAACRVLADELDYEISLVDPKKTLQVEGFRVDPRGNQKSKEIPYARSETHLTELMESVCANMNNYAKSSYKSGGLKYVRTKKRDHEKYLKLDSISIDKSTSEKLRFMCDNIMEEHDEDILDFFKKPAEHAVDELCMIKLGLCKLPTPIELPNSTDDDVDESSEKDPNSTDDDVDESSEKGQEGSAEDKDEL